MTEDSELFGPQQENLPEFHGNLAEVNHYLESVRRYYDARRDHEELHIQAEVPQIIGRVPSQEREFFQSFEPREGLPSYGVILDHKGEDFGRIVSEMPDTLEMIDEDILALHAIGLALDSVIVDRKTTQAGKSPRPSVKWHTDPEAFYVISDNNATEFYAGPAIFKSPASGGFSLDPESIDNNTRAIAAPQFAIVRLGPLHVHRSPTFQRDADRTFMAFLTTMQ